MTTLRQGLVIYTGGPRQKFMASIPRTEGTHVTTRLREKCKISGLVASQEWMRTEVKQKNIVTVEVSTTHTEWCDRQLSIKGNNPPSTCFFLTDLAILLAVLKNLFVEIRSAELTLTWRNSNFQLSHRNRYEEFGPSPGSGVGLGNDRPISSRNVWIYLVVSVNVTGWRNTCCVRFTHTRCYISISFFCETNYLVCEIISVSEKRMKNCRYCENYWKCF